jgi:hypothetical protein
MNEVLNLAGTVLLSAIIVLVIIGLAVLYILVKGAIQVKRDNTKIYEQSLKTKNDDIKES